MNHLQRLGDAYHDRGVYQRMLNSLRTEWRLEFSPAADCVDGVAAALSLMMDPVNLVSMLEPALTCRVEFVHPRR
jgi:hypothetical protein